MKDPFSSDEAQATQEPEEKHIGTATVKVTPVLDDTIREGKLTVTFKGGTGYDSPWIVLHAADVADAYGQVTGENATALANLMEHVQKAGKHFVSLGGGQAARQQVSSAPPQASQEAPGGEKRFCTHGEMRFKSDISKAGKAYSGFFCPERDRNLQCKAQFL